MSEPTPVSQAEAADALHAIAEAQQRSRTLYGYRMASPYLILWGIIWVIGYGTSATAAVNWIWLGLVIAGIYASFWIGDRQKHRSEAGQWVRYVAAMLAVFAFLAGLFAIVRPASTAQADAVIPLLVAIAYVLHGIFASGARMWVTGLAIGILTVAGFVWMPQYFLAWMAVTGGGGLILGGVWLRSA